MGKILTIVIPSYNVESTLRETVESLIVPDTQMRECLDILIVDDGSKDGTPALADQLAQEFPGIVRAWHKENGGHGSTINVGIEQGYGKYMKVVDGDDWLSTDALEVYLKILRETDADVVATDYYHCYMNDGRREVVKSSQLPYGKILRFADVWDQYSFFMHSLAVKTDLLRNQPHRIDERCYYVDVEYDSLVAIVIETVLYVDLKLYNYRLQQAGQSVSVEGWMKHYPEHARVTNTLIAWYQELTTANNKRQDRIAYIEKRIIRSVSGHYTIGLGFPGDARKEFLVHLKQYDTRLKGQGEPAYQLAAKKPVVRLLRICNFSGWIYSAIADLRKFIKH